MTRKRIRQMMMVQMLPHMVLGHPIAALLSYVGLWRLCEWWHYFTLPRRAKRKISEAQLDYCHDRSVFWVDFFFAPATHVLGTLGFHYLGFRLYMKGPLEAAINHSTHFNFLLWSQYSPDPDERAYAEKLMESARCRRARLTLQGHPRWPHLTPRAQNLINSREGESI